jgi:hypothetical protein
LEQDMSDGVITRTSFAVLVAHDSDDRKVAM